MNTASERSREWQRKNRDAFRAISRRYKRKRNYGITDMQYQKLLDEQDGKCAICEKPETCILRGTLAALAVDHDHVTGQIRGLLCQRCNRSIGLLYDDPVTLDKAAAYLRKTVSKENHDGNRP